jgi:osmotically-inducible protein OsmY
MKKVYLIIGFLFFSLYLFSGCTSFKGETAGEYLDDSTITAQVNGVIVKDPNAQYFKIDVTTIQGEIVLQGFIDSRDSEDRIVEKIHQIRGVKSVKSMLRLDEKK